VDGEYRRLRAVVPDVAAGPRGLLGADLDPPDDVDPVAVPDRRRVVVGRRVAVVADDDPVEAVRRRGQGVARDRAATVRTRVDRGVTPRRFVGSAPGVLVPVVGVARRRTAGFRPGTGTFRSGAVAHSDSRAARAFSTALSRSAG
jgi:hypothetical protein